MHTFKPIKAAFSGKKAVKIEVVDGTVVVWHYSTKIAVIGENSVEIYTNGWRTVTTKRHINTIFDALDVNASVYQKDYIWHIVVNDIDIHFFDGFAVNF